MARRMENKFKTGGDKKKALEERRKYFKWTKQLQRTSERERLLAQCPETMVKRTKSRRREYIPKI